MKATANRRALADALGWVAKIVKANPQMPMLAGVHVKVDEDAQAITLSTTDYDQWLTADVPAVVPDFGSGEAVVSAAKLAALVGAMAGDDVDLSGDDHVLVQSGRAKYTFAHIPVDQWPASPDAGETLFLIDADAFAYQWERVAFAAGDDPSKPQVYGVQIRAEADRVMLGAGKSSMAAVTRFQCDIVSQGFAQVRPKQISDALNGMAGLVTVAVSGGTITLGAADRSCTMRALDVSSPYPIEKSFERVVGIPTEVDVAELLGAIKRAELASALQTVGKSDGGGNVGKHVILDAEDGEIRVLPVGDDISGSDGLDGLFASPVRARFNFGFLRDVLGGLDAKRATITLPDVDTGFGACLVTEAGVVDPQYRIVVMSVKEIGS